MGWFGGSKEPEPKAVEPPPPPIEPEVSQKDIATLIAENAGPISGQIGMGGVFGYCSGYALQKAGS